MFRIIFGLILIFSCSIAHAQAITPEQAIADIAKNLGQKKVKSIQSEVEDVVVHLLSVPEEDRPFIRYFTVYAVPEELREDVWLQLSFVAHSLVGPSLDKEANAGSYYPIATKNNGTKEKPLAKPEFKLYNQVSETIVWVDIRNYNWTPQAWELVSKEDGFFVEPIVDYKTNGALRLLAGNAVLRADWFVTHATDIKAQEDRESNNIIYNNLLYANNKTPKTLKEFETIWGLPDRDKSRQIGNEALLLTVNEQQNVARHNRILRGNRTEFGWLMATYDVNHESGKRDFVEAFHEFKGKPPETFDGGEVIAANQLQMQVYSLYNAQEQLVNDAPAGLARHLGDVIGDARVRVPTSCIDCHSAGPIPGENVILNYIKSNGLYSEYLKEDKLRVERAYLSGKFEDLVDDGQLMFARAMKKINGLTPDENGASYLRVISWYNKPLDLKQILVECGEPDEANFRAKMGLTKMEHVKKKVPGRLSVLLETGIKIPRSTWESPGRDGYPGVFQQTMILLNGLTAIEYNFAQYIIIEKGVSNYAFATEGGRSVWVTLDVNSQYKILDRSHSEYYKIDNNGQIVFVNKRLCKLVE